LFSLVINKKWRSIDTFSRVILPCWTDSNTIQRLSSLHTFNHIKITLTIIILILIIIIIIIFEALI